VERHGITSDLSGDLVLGDLTTQERQVECLFAPLRISDDMLAVGPLERDQRRLFLPTDVDVERGDDLTWLDAENSAWIVTATPTLHYMRGAEHHLEALVERKAIT